LNDRLDDFPAGRGLEGGLDVVEGELLDESVERELTGTEHLNELWDEQLRDRVTLDDPSHLEAQAEGRSGNPGIGLPAGDQSNFAERGKGRDGGGEHVCASSGVEDEVDPSTGDLAKLTCNVGAA
jgi:hypothetical protein